VQENVSPGGSIKLEKQLFWKLAQKKGKKGCDKRGFRGNAKKGGRRGKGGGGHVSVSWGQKNKKMPAGESTKRSGKELESK